MISIDLTSKTAIVTGSGQGLGKSIASTLYAAGANLVINYFPDSAGENQSKAEETVSELGERAIALPADVRNPNEIEQMISQTLDKFSSYDILVNNAGILRDRSVKKMTFAEWQDVIDTNLTGVFNCCKCSLEPMADQGRVINIASLAAAVGFFGQANYASAKAGVIALTKVLSKEMAKKQITVNSVAPGVVLTEMGKSIPEENRKAMIAQIPLGRFGEPEEIAGVVTFLASKLSSYVTGQTIHTNGGWWAN